MNKSRRRYEDNIKTDLKEIACGDVEWVYLVQDMVHWRAYVNTATNLCAS